MSLCLPYAHNRRVMSSSAEGFSLSSSRSGSTSATVYLTSTWETVNKADVPHGIILAYSTTLSGRSEHHDIIRFWTSVPNSFTSPRFLIIVRLSTSLSLKWASTITRMFRLHSKRTSETVRGLWSPWGTRNWIRDIAGSILMYWQFSSRWYFFHFFFRHEEERHFISRCYSIRHQI